MRVRSLVTFVASFCCALSYNPDYDSDQEQTHRWIVPTQPGPVENFGGNLLWSEGSTVTLEWTSTLEQYKIDLYQQRLDRPAAYRIETVFNSSDASGSNQLKWTVQTYETNLTFSPVFFFWLNPVSTKGRTSHYFNITEPSPSSSASSVSSTSSSVVAGSTRTEASASETSTSNPSGTTTSDTNSASATSADASAALAATKTQDAAIASDATATNNPMASDLATPIPKVTTTDQTSFKVGLGVGLGLGIPLFLLIGTWVGLKLWRQWRADFRKRGSSVSLAEINDTKHDPYRYANSDEAYYPHRGYRHEMSSSEPQLYEVPGVGRKPSELAA